MNLGQSCEQADSLPHMISQLGANDFWGNRPLFRKRGSQVLSPKGKIYPKRGPKSECLTAISRIINKYKIEKSKVFLLIPYVQATRRRSQT